MSVRPLLDSPGTAQPCWQLSVAFGSLKVDGSPVSSVNYKCVEHICYML